MAVSRTRFAWENGTLKPQPGPGPPHGGNSREKLTRKIHATKCPQFGPLFGHHFRGRFWASWEHCWKNSREKFTRRTGPLTHSIFGRFGPCLEPALVGLSELAFGIKNSSRAFALRRISTISAHTAQECDTAFGVIGYRLGSGGVLEARTP